MEAIKYYVKGAFVGVAETPDALEQQEELIADLTAKVADLVADGRPEDEALGMAIASMGDLSALVREFAAEEPVAPPPAEVVVVPTVEVYASRLRLHTVALSAGGAVAVLFVLSVLAAVGGTIAADAAVMDLLLGVLALVWIGYTLRAFHRAPDEIATLELGAPGRLRKAVVQWAAVCAIAIVLNVVLGSEDFWAWTVWVATAAWPASVIVEQKLLVAGKFLYPKVPAAAPAQAEHAAAGAPTGNCA
jgi:hypothetical protein